MGILLEIGHIGVGLRLSNLILSVMKAIFSEHTLLVKREFLSVRFIKFLIAGGIAALINISSRILLNYYLPYSVSIVAAYIIGMTTAYILNRWLVFGASVKGQSYELIMFTLVNLLAVGQTLAISLLLAYYALPALGVTWQARTIAHIIGVIVPVFTSFVGHKYWSFRGHKN